LEYFSSIYWENLIKGMKYLSQNIPTLAEIRVRYLLQTHCCLSQATHHHHHHHHRRSRQSIHLWARSFLRRSCQSCHPGFSSLSFATVIFVRSKVVILASNPQPGGPGLCIYVLQWQGGSVKPPATGFPFCCLLWLLNIANIT
jgi:hypothetical protein